MSRFSDIDLKFIPHPTTKQVKNLDAKTAIQRALNHLLFTRQGEKLYNNDFGVGIQDYIFELNNFIQEDLLRTNIRNQIVNYERRVILEDVTVEQDLNNITINISYRLKSDPQELLTFARTLKRIR
jgi:phage baseplate assembly protein W